MQSLKKAGVLALTLAAVLCSGHAWADNSSPVGLWKNIDDKSGKPKALIRITESNGVLQGQIEKLFRTPNEDPNPNCEKCTDARRDKPVIGMVIMTDLKKDGDEYNGGKILDPDDGEIYKCKISLIDGGKKLNMRGYVGLPIVGRTQTWVRQE